jgi:hypothetical protein
MMLGLRRMGLGGGRKGEGSGGSGSSEGSCPPVRLLKPATAPTTPTST